MAFNVFVHKPYFLIPIHNCFSSGFPIRIPRPFLIIATALKEYQRHLCQICGTPATKSCVGILIHINIKPYCFSFGFPSEFPIMIPIPSLISSQRAPETLPDLWNTGTAPKWWVVSLKLPKLKFQTGRKNWHGIHADSHIQLDNFVICRKLI